MADLQIPQRQTFPAIRGSVSDEVGLIDLSTALTISLILNGPGGTPVVLLPAVALDPTEPFTVNGVTYEANWEAPLAGATSAVANEILYSAKLKIVWQTSPTLLQQFAPQVGFMQIEIVKNVVEA
jgi:hypothetical protein